MSKTGFEKAKDFIIKAGFGFIKLEMEADLGREDDESNECSDCYGEGTVECYECEGSGVVMATRPNGSEFEVECDVCDGEGNIECESCDGSGRRESDDVWSLARCEDYIKDYVSPVAREALVYSEFYHDGSVDSEMTLTIPTRNAEYLIEYMEAFKALSNEIGNGLVTGGAGLHITVIPDSEGYYPSRCSLNSEKYLNFERQVTKLLPALYMLASADDISRGLNYRQPRVSNDNKYSAIFAYDTSSIEYRLFETCYDNPEMVKEYIEVIAKTLRFYDDPSLKVDDLGKTFGLNDSDNMVSRFYTKADDIKILRDRLKYVKPDGKSMSELMKSRKVPTITELNKITSHNRAEARKKWFEANKRIKVLEKQPLTDYQKSNYEYYIKNGHTEKDAMVNAKGIIPLPPLVQYLREQLSHRDVYSLSV